MHIPTWDTLGGPSRHSITINQSQWAFGVDMLHVLRIAGRQLLRRTGRAGRRWQRSCRSIHASSGMLFLRVCGVHDNTTPAILLTCLHLSMQVCMLVQPTSGPSLDPFIARCKLWCSSLIDFISLFNRKLDILINYTEMPVGETGVCRRLPCYTASSQPREMGVPFNAQIAPPKYRSKFTVGILFVHDIEVT